MRNEKTSTKNIPRICENCQEQFFISKSLASRVKKGTKSAKYCSRECLYENKRKRKKLKCEECEKTIEKRECDIKKSKNHFCSKSCSAKYNNKNKIQEQVICLNCSKHFNKKRNSKNKFCCNKCSSEYKKQENIQKWKNGELVGYSGKTYQIKQFIRNYLIKKSKCKCSKCGWSKINQKTNKVPLEINHIDGDPQNSKESNLEVLCPNCHALTENFRSLNKNSCRRRK